MKLLCLVIGLLLPQVLLAQLSAFEPGSYVLAANRAVRHASLLKLRSSTVLLAKDADDKNIRLTPAEVSSFRIGARKFFVVSDVAEQEEDGAAIGGIFVELLDSGTVTLMRYEYAVSTAPMMGAGGGMSYGGSSGTRYVYMVCWSAAKDPTITVLPTGGMGGSGKKFREALLPYLAARPDLTKLAQDKRLTAENLRATIRALNAGKPFALSASDTY